MPRLAVKDPALMQDMLEVWDVQMQGVLIANVSRWMSGNHGSAEKLLIVSHHGYCRSSAEA